MTKYRKGILRKILAGKEQISEEAIAHELAILGFADLTEFVTWGPGGVRLKESDALDAATRRAIIEVSENQHGVRIKLADKKGALDSMAKILGMFNDKKPESDSGPMQIEIVYTDPSPT